jgi:protein SCO1/2
MTAAHVRLAVLTLAGLAVGALTGLALLPLARERVLPNPGVKVWGEALIGGPFALTDTTGKRVTDRDFRGCTLLVVFGATTQDATASALQVLVAALDKLGAKADRAVPILITVDPGHDTPERLQRYLARFHPHVVGLTGTAAQIAQVLHAYRVEVSGPDDRPVDAPARIYVMGPDGRYRGHIYFTAGVDAVAASLADML